VRGRLRSYRFRRKLIRLSIALVLVGSAATISVLFWNTADAKETFSTEPATLFDAPAKRTLSAEAEKEVLGVARHFVANGVTRAHPERVYDRVGELLRGGLTREQWKTQDIPIVHYPVGEARWKFEYVNAEAVGLAVLLFPREGATQPPAIFTMRLEPARSEAGWLVTSWSPRGASPANTTPGAGTGDTGAAAAATEVVTVRRASLAWLLLPVGILGIGLMIPVVLVLRSMRATRRIRRAMGAAGTRHR
jgi:hypothetical protein